VPTSKFGSYLLGKRLFGKAYENWHNRRADHYHLDNKQRWLERLKKYGFEVFSYYDYLNNKPVMYFFDLAHYLGVPSLISKKLFNNWVIFPFFREAFPWERIIQELFSKGKSGRGAYMFFGCKKT
jgi:hypothetical protein